MQLKHFSVNSVYSSVYCVYHAELMNDVDKLKQRLIEVLIGWLRAADRC